MPEARKLYAENHIMGIMGKEQEQNQAKRRHRATYSRDKLHGGYLVRVEGPTANRFAGREVPVSRKNGTESQEKLDTLIWSGNDEESGLPVALYSFLPSPLGQDEQQELPF